MSAFGGKADIEISGGAMSAYDPKRKWQMEAVTDPIEMHLVIGLCSQYQQRREPRGFDRTNPFKSGILKPAADFIERKGIALVRVHQHIDGENQGWDRRLRINQNPTSHRRAIGDVRAKSVKRVAPAVGEGAQVAAGAASPSWPAAKFMAVGSLVRTSAA
jgi:hypothetical protein